MNCSNGEFDLNSKLENHEPVFREIQLRGFTPLTSSSNKTIKRKENLKDLIEKKIGKDLKKIQKRCLKRHLLAKVVFYVIESDEKGRSKPDLDNLLKPLFDVLSVNMVNGQESHAGVGLMENDSQIYEIRCKKIPVDTESEEGIDLQISIFTKTI